MHSFPGHVDGSFKGRHWVELHKPTRIELKLEFFFPGFPGFPKPPSFWQRFGMSPMAWVEELLPCAGELTSGWKSSVTRDLGILSVIPRWRWIEAMGCHTDSSYFRYYIHLQIHRIWMNMFRGDSNITKVTYQYQNEWWLWWCVWSPLLGVETTQYMPESQFVCCLTFLRVSNSMFQLGDGFATGSKCMAQAI